MRCVLILLFFSSLLTLALSRPPGYEDKSNDSEAEDMEYEGEDDAGEDLEDEGFDEKDSARSNFESSQGSNYRFFLQNSEENKPKANMNSLNISEIQVPSEQNEDDSSNPEKNEQYEHNRRSPGAYSEQNNDANDQQETSQHFPNRDVNNYQGSRFDDVNNGRKVNKRTEKHDQAAEGTLLFERNPNNAEYNNQNDPSVHSDKLNKQYLNVMDAERGDSRLDSEINEDVNYNRDRRQAQCINRVSNPIDEKSAIDLANEDEESAIKRHVKKLSSEEYEQLLNSLTEDKKILLKKIMDSDSGVENGYENVYNIKKREITKKTGAVEENIMESGQIDISKVVSSLPGLEASTESTSATEMAESSKQTETEPTKSMETSAVAETKTEMVTKSDDTKEVKTETTTSLEPKSDTATNVSSDSDSQVTQKSPNKREVNIEDFNDSEETAENLMKYNADLADSDLFNEQGYLTELEEELSNDKFEQNESNIRKRDTSMQTDTEFADSMQSLEDSFPNPNAYDDADPYLGSKMAPLVRVKRAKKHADPSASVIKKRAAGVLPDAKVAFFPDRAETEDDDNEEANEFDNEGFYDHYAANNERSEHDSSANERLLSSYLSKSDNVAPANENAIVHSNKDTLESDNVGIGSDTDSVLSGIEGVDDNLMFSNVARDRRSEDANKNSEINEYNRENEDAAKINERHRDLSDLNAPNYQVNDAFGPLPRNFEEDLGRYKRVRRVKHGSSNSNS